MSQAPPSGGRSRHLSRSSPPWKAESLSSSSAGARPWPSQPCDLPEQLFGRQPGRGPIFMRPQFGQSLRRRFGR
jgi:hypothetical protein